MEDVKTETTQVADQTTQKVEEKQIEQGTDGEKVQDTTQKTPEQTTEVKDVKKVEEKQTTPSSVQARIDKMYARLQSERAARIKAETEVKTQKFITTGETEGEKVEPKPLTEVDVQNIISRQESEKRFIDSEIKVLERHPEALNEDGNYNMKDIFVQKYVEIGRRNPMLLGMENGPELAEAMAEKELGLSYTKGRKDEAKRLQTQDTNTHVSTSTVSIPRTTGTKTQLNEVQKKIAARMGMTEEQYVQNQSSTKIVQKRWDSMKRV